MKNSNKFGLFRTFPYQNTYFGFYVTWFLQSLGAANYLVLFSVVVLAEIGLCLFVTVCAEDFKEQFSRFQSSGFKNRVETKAILKDAIEIHQTMRQLSTVHTKNTLLYLFIQKRYFKPLFEPVLCGSLRLEI